MELIKEKKFLMVVYRCMIEVSKECVVNTVSWLLDLYG